MLKSFIVFLPKKIIKRDFEERMVCLPFLLTSPTFYSFSHSYSQIYNLRDPSRRVLGWPCSQSSGLIAFSLRSFPSAPPTPPIVHVESQECICPLLDGSHSVVIYFALCGPLMPFEFLKSLLCKSTCVLGLASDYRISRDYTVCLMSPPSFLSDLWH